MATRHIFYDCESLNDCGQSQSHIQKTQLKLLLASYVRLSKGSVAERSLFAGQSGSSFWQWVYEKCSKRGELWVWSHNAKCDLTWSGFWQELDSGRCKMGKRVLEFPPVIVRCSCSKGNFVVVDSLNWFNMPLREVAKWCKTKKLVYPGDDAEMAELLPYCRNDVNILERSVLKATEFMRNNDCGSLALTVAMQAKRAWRRWYRGPRIDPHGNADIAKAERAAYYGGRVELGFNGVVTLRKGRPDYLCKRGVKSVKHIGGTKIHVLDIRSFYPSVMRDLLLPYRYSMYFREMSLAGIRQTLEHTGCIAWCHIDASENAYPYRSSKGTVYAKGMFWTQLAGPEIQLALSCGELRRVTDVHTYRVDTIFRQFVDNLYPLRERMLAAKDTVGEALCKLLLNSLYGKFGQRSGGWTEQPDFPSDIWKNIADRLRGKFPGVIDDSGRLRWGHWPFVDTETGEVAYWRAIAGRIEKLCERGEHPNAMVAIPAYVTSAGRAKLSRLIAALPERTLLYVDTDCLHVTDLGLAALERKSLITGERLGGLRLVSSHKEGEYVQRKCYRLDGEWTIAGRKKTSADVHHHKWIQSVWDSFMQILERGPSAEIHIRERLMRLDTLYKSGCRDAAGWCSPPNAASLQADPSRFVPSQTQPNPEGIQDP